MHNLHIEPTRMFADIIIDGNAQNPEQIFQTALNFLNNCIELNSKTDSFFHVK